MFQHKLRLQIICYFKEKSYFEYECKHKCKGNCHKCRFKILISDCTIPICHTPVLTCARYQEAFKTNLITYNNIKSRMFGYINTNKKMIESI